MDERDVRSLLEAGVDDSSSRNLASGLWERAQRERTKQRLRVGLSTACAAVIVVAVVAMTGTMNAGREVQPTGPVASPSETAPEAQTQQPPQPTTSYDLSDYPFADSPAGRVDVSVVQDLWTETRAESVPWAGAPIPRSISLAGAADLSADPVEHALMAVQVGLDRTVAGDIFLLGDDMRWRRVDVPGLQPPRDEGSYGNDYLRPTSLTPDGERLALPQPGGIVVVDLSAGHSERYEVPGLNRGPIWSADGQHILTGTDEGHPGGRLLSLRDGSVQPAPHRGMLSDTTFAPDGALIELHGVKLKGYHFEIRTDGGADVPAVPLTVDVSNGYYMQTVHASDDAIAFVRAVNGWRSPRGRDERPGIFVVDRFTGDPLAQLPLLSYGLLEESSPMGWLDEETLLLKLGSEIVSWHYPSGDLRRIMTTDDEPVGLAFAPAAVAATLN